MRNRFFLTVLIIIFALAGSITLAQNESIDDLKIAQCKDFEITIGSYKSMAMTQSAVLRNQINTDDLKRKEFLDKIINMNLMSTEAIKRGYDKNPEVLTAYKNRLATLLQNEITQDFKLKNPTDAQLLNYYNNHIERYNKPTKVRIRQILKKDKNEAAKLLQSIKTNGTTQYEFRRIAQTQSEDQQSKNKGGDLTFFSEDGTRGQGQKIINEKIVQAAFSLEKNSELYPDLIETKDGFHIIMKTGYRKAVTLNFEDAKPRLVRLVQKFLHEQQLDNAIDELKIKYKVKLFEENLKHVVIDLSKPATQPEPVLQNKGSNR